MIGDMIVEPILELVLMPISKATVKLWETIRGVFRWIYSFDSSVPLCLCG